MAGIPQVSVLAPRIVQPIYIDAPAAPGNHLALFAEHNSVWYLRQHRKHERCYLTRISSWSVCWNLMIAGRKTQAIYFHKRLTIPNNLLQLNGRDIPFCNYCNMFWYDLRQENNMEISREVRIQGLARVKHKEIIYIQSGR